LHRILLSGRIAHHFTAFADALIRLDVRTGRDLLQVDLDGLRTFLAFEGERASRFVSHFAEIGKKGIDRKQIARRAPGTLDAEV
jgi:hypothetical protein